ENESAKRVNTVGPRLIFDWNIAANEMPLRQAIGQPDATPEQLKWQTFSPAPKKVPPGQALFVEFRDAIEPVEIGGGFSTGGSEVRLAAVPGPQFPPQMPRVANDWSAIRFPTSD